MQPLISIIVPVYGVEKYIAQCLDSLVNQTYKNIEVIVVNDGTKDKSAIIAKTYAEKDSRIVVFDYENGGLSVARNRGLTHVKGDYIAFLDSDDWVAPSMYEKLIDVLEKTGADMVKCGVIETSETRADVHTFPKTDLLTANFDMYYGGFLNTVVWNAVYKRELALKVEYPANVVHEDNYATGMYIHYAEKIAFVKEAYNYYRVNMNGISKGINKRPLDRFIAVDKLVKDLSKDGFKDDRLLNNMAKDVYHYLRDNNPLVRIIAIQKGMLDFVLKNLDLRRKLQFMFLLKKKGIKVI